MSTESPGLHDLDADELQRRVARSGLRGRGGGWFPVAHKWHAVRVEGGEPVVVANGAEGEPGSIKDRFLMTRRPAAVLEGLRLAARAVRARKAIVYLKGSFAAPAAALEAALRDQSGDGLDIRVVRGADTYIAGEETAALEFLEGRRAWPRPKPPLPAAVGLEGRPTLVQNVETLSRLSDALSDPEAFRAQERTWVSLWGHVRRPGLYDVPLGTPLARLIDEHGQGATDGVSFIFPAGPSAAPLTSADAATPLHPDRLREKGSALGTGSILVVGRSACPLAVAASLAAFFEAESCGQCPPCALGTVNLGKLVRAVETGGARRKDLQDLSEVAGFMSGHGYCAHSRTAAASLTGLLARCPESIDAHLAAGRCPHAPEARVDPFGSRSPERQAIESVLQAGLAS